MYILLLLIAYKSIRFLSQIHKKIMILALSKGNQNICVVQFLKYLFLKFFCKSRPYQILIIIQKNLSNLLKICAQ